MIETSIEISGLRELEKELNKLSADIGFKTLRSALRDAAKPILEDMQANAPVDQGLLKGQLKIRSISKGKSGMKKVGRKGAAGVQVGAFNVPYIVQIEYGASNKNIPATPFLRNSTRKSDEATRIFKTRLSRKIQLAKQRAARRRR